MKHETISDTHDDTTVPVDQIDPQTQEVEIQHVAATANIIDVKSNPTSDHIRDSEAEDALFHDCNDIDDFSLARDGGSIQAIFPVSGNSTYSYVHVHTFI